MAQPEIVSLAEIVAYLGLGSSLAPADAGLIQMLKAMVENQARAFCGHHITQPADPHVEYLPEPRAGRRRSTSQTPRLSDRFAGCQQHSAAHPNLRSRNRFGKSALT